MTSYVPEMTSDLNPDGWAVHEANYYFVRLDKVVADLRRLADEISREGQPHKAASFDGTPRFANAAHKVHHALVWGVANLGAEYIIDAAGRADHAEAQEAKGQA